MRALRTDRGASTIEYAGLIVLAALILGSLTAIGIPGEIRASLTPALCKIVGGTSCGGDTPGGPSKDSRQPSGGTPLPGLNRPPGATGPDPGLLPSLKNTLGDYWQGFENFAGFNAKTIAPGPPPKDLRPIPVPAPAGILDELKEQVEGIGSAAKFVWCPTGLCSHAAVKEARDGWSYLWHHPGESANQIFHSIIAPCLEREKLEKASDYDSRKINYWQGRCVTSVVTSFVGAKGIGKLGKLAKVGKVAKISKIAKLAGRFGKIATKLQRLGLSAEQIERLLSKLDPRLRRQLEQLADRAAKDKALAPVLKKTLGDLYAADKSGKLDKTSFHSLVSRLTDPKASREAIQGVASEIAAARRVIDSGDLAPGTKVATHATKGSPVDLGDGKPVDVGPVNQADLVYKDSKGVVHLAEVKNAAVSLVNKIASDPTQLRNLGRWARAGSGRQAEVAIESEHKWTDLFGEPGGMRPDAMQRIIQGNVSLRIAGRSYSPAELKTLRTATAKKLGEWKKAHPEAKNDSGFYNQPQMRTIDSAKQYLGIS